MPSGMNKQWHEKIGYKAWEWLLEDKKGGASFIQMATWKEAAKRFDDEDDDTETIIEAGFETLIKNWRNTISEVLGFEDRNMKFVFSCYNERTGTDGALMKDGQVIKGIMKTHYKSDFKEKDVKAYYNPSEMSYKELADKIFDMSYIKASYAQCEKALKPWVKKFNKLRDEDCDFEGYWDDVLGALDPLDDGKNLLRGQLKVAIQKKGKVQLSPATKDGLWLHIWVEALASVCFNAGYPNGGHPMGTCRIVVVEPPAGIRNAGGSGPGQKLELHILKRLYKKFPYISQGVDLVWVQQTTASGDSTIQPDSWDKLASIPNFTTDELQGALGDGFSKY